MRRYSWSDRIKPLPAYLHPLMQLLMRLRRPAGWLVRDADITRRAALVISFRAIDAALDIAQERAAACRAFLSELSWPASVVADSGTSIDLLYAVNLPHTQASTILIHQVLTALDQRFSDDQVGVDTRADAAAARIRLYGTLGAGADYRSAILHLPDTLVPVATDHLTALPATDLSPTSDDSTGIRPFVTNQCRLEPAAWTPTHRLFGRYRLSCHAQGIEPVIIERFARQLIVAFGLVAERRKVQGAVVRGLKGIRLTSAAADACPDKSERP